MGSFWELLVWSTLISGYTGTSIFWTMSALHKDSKLRPWCTVSHQNCYSNFDFQETSLYRHFLKYLTLLDLSCVLAIFLSSPPINCQSKHRPSPWSNNLLIEERGRIGRRWSCFETSFFGTSPTCLKWRQKAKWNFIKIWRTFAVVHFSIIKK